MDDMKPVTDQRELRDAFGCFPSGVTAICALSDTVPVGMAVSSFISVSLEPPLVAICMQNGSETWQKLNALSHLGVSVLGSGHDAACRQLSAKLGDRFAGVTWEASSTGAVFIAGAAVWLDCTIDQRIVAGDHEIVVLRIERLKMERDVSPLVFHASRFHKLASHSL
jgi:flavin reductase (DIM6/NTAB) family NADH-FMN oxidoreductase RutF